ncbi:MAG: hypothetical protein WB508_07010, partial [Aeromicrobium sp.]|uniref:hypothetical protein n=1 Tax=Aeromicrobium sp. TaxID=1871063 RepID=UPI003C608701
MALRGRRPCSALLVLIWALIPVVALATPASAAPPDPPAMQSGYDDVTVAYYESPFVAGTKPVGTSVVVQRVSDGSEVDCFGQDIPDLTAWTCSMSAREFPQDPDTGTLVQLTAHAVNAQEEESEKTPITLRIQPSRFGVTTSPDLPDGDRIVLEGSREMHAGGVRWTVTRDDDTLVSFQPCAFDDPDEGETFVCTYDSEATPAGTAAAGPPGATAALASGSYTARLQEFADDGATDQIDEIVFAFTVGSPPAVAPPPSPPPPPTTQTP